MNSTLLKTVLKYAGAWGVALIFVALLTIIFSFLGTLFCAAAGGMMMGATRASKKLSLGFSVFCPAVLVATLQIQKTELPQSKLMALALICLVAFWMLYLMAWLLVAYEKQSASPIVPMSVASSLDSLMASQIEEHLAEKNSDTYLKLEELEGEWTSERCGTNGHQDKRVLEISGESLEVRTLDAQGHIRFCSRGRLKLLQGARIEALDSCTSAELAAGI